MNYKLRQTIGNRLFCLCGWSEDLNRFVAVVSGKRTLAAVQEFYLTILGYLRTQWYSIEELLYGCSFL